MLLGFALIAALIAVQVVVLYVISMLVVAGVSRFAPLVGRKHRHKDWDRLNRGDPKP